ncbi:glucosaminidase domain-containing protein [Heyndrickxia sporothermodurans]
MKKIRGIFACFSALLLFVSALPISTQAVTVSTNINQSSEVKATVVGETSDSFVDLLETADEKSKIIGEIPDSAEVIILEKGEVFSLIKYIDKETEESIEGYLPNDHLVESTTTADEKEQSTNEVGETSDEQTPDGQTEESSEQVPVEQDKEQATVDEQASTDKTATTEEKQTTTTNEKPQIKSKASVERKVLAVQSTEVIKGVALKNPTNIYSTATTSSKVLKSYSQGTVLQFHSYNSSWYECQVYINGKATVGYILASDVDKLLNSSKDLKGIALKDSTKVYSKAAESSTVLKSYSQGSILQYHPYSSNWYQCTVVINGKKTTGYIYVKDVENVVASSKSLQGVALKSPTIIYSKASDSAKSLKSYSQGTILKYRTFTSNWYEATVYINGKATIGYIKSNDVENSDPTPTNLRGIALSKVYVYSKASTNSTQVKSYSEGSILKYHTFATGWYQSSVTVNGAVKTIYIKASDVENAISSPSKLQGLAMKNPTYVYSKASKSSKTLKGYSKGAILKFTSFTSDWYECTVVVNGKSVLGYINKADVKVSSGNVIKQTTKYPLAYSDALAMQMKAGALTDASGQWKAATKSQVDYYLNPLNFSQTSPSFYQFLVLSSYTGTKASELNSKLLNGKGILNGTGASFIEAAKKYGINEIYLLNHALHETGNGTSKLSTGIKVNGVTVYNVYGIGALDSDPNGLGAKYAYDHGWTTIQKAIVGGAQFVSENYIHNGQDTLYKMRWNPDGMVAKGYANHQYASDIGWAEKQTYSIVQAYNQLSDFILMFDVPKYQ